MQECTASLVARAQTGGLPGAVGQDDVTALADAAAWLRAEGAAGQAGRLIGFTTAGWWAEVRE